MICALHLQSSACGSGLQPPAGYWLPIAGAAAVRVGADRVLASGTR